MKLLQRNGKRGELFKPFETRLDFFRDELENVFEQAWRAFPTEPWLPVVKPRQQQWPPFNVIEDELGLVIEVEVPGFGPKEVQVEVEGRLLTVRGIREQKTHEVPEKKGITYFERHIDNFERTLTIPEYFDPEKIEAKYEKGTLIIRLLRLPGKAPKIVPIKTI
jgi:HSP20 family protein